MSSYWFHEVNLKLSGFIQFTGAPQEKGIAVHENCRIVYEPLKRIIWQINKPEPVQGEEATRPQKEGVTTKVKIPYLQRTGLSKKRPRSVMRGLVIRGAGHELEH